LNQDPDRHDDEAIERWAADDMSGPEREAWERRALESPERSEELYAAISMRETLRETANATPTRRRTRWAPRRLAAGAVAVAAVVAFVVFGPLTEPGDDGTPRLRGTGSSITPLAPEGELDHFPHRFTWSTTTEEPGTTYRWELYDARARRRATEVVADTLLVRDPGSTPADSTGRWRWIVVEIAPDGAEGGTSASTSFEVVPPR
jgi:hypothetical protein